MSHVLHNIILIIRGEKMQKFCEKCKKAYDSSVKKCPGCGNKLKKEYSADEIREMENTAIMNSITTINSLF